MTVIYAEDSPYWVTEVPAARSQEEIVRMLQEFGAEQILVAQGQSNQRFAWLVRFHWGGRNYRFVFAPKPTRSPEKVLKIAKKKRTYLEQAKNQMGRTAAWFVKAVLAAAEENDAVLFGFLELTGPYSRPDGIPPVASEVDVSDLASRVPLLHDFNLPTQEGDTP